jgi:hypothetical protein
MYDSSVYRYQSVNTGSTFRIADAIKVAGGEHNQWEP